MSSHSLTVSGLDLSNSSLLSGKVIGYHTFTFPEPASLPGVSFSFGLLQKIFSSMSSSLATTVGIFAVFPTMMLLLPILYRTCLPVFSFTDNIESLFSNRSCPLFRKIGAEALFEVLPILASFTIRLPPSTIMVLVLLDISVFFSNVMIV